MAIPIGYIKNKFWPLTKALTFRLQQGPGDDVTTSRPRWPYSHEAVDDLVDIPNGHPIFEIIGKIPRTASCARVAKPIGIEEILRLFRSVLPPVLIILINAWAIQSLTPIKFGEQDF